MPESSSEFRYLYLHGFGSDRSSAKGVELCRQSASAGVELELLDLNIPTFETQTFTQILGYLDRVDSATPEGKRLRIGGSSMGGYLAARWAELNPDRVERLFLLCPGFDLISRLPTLVGEQSFRDWERDGVLHSEVDDGRKRSLHWDFVVDARRHPTHPVVPCPTQIVHGTQDETVPIESSRSYAARFDGVELLELEDDHRLMSSLDSVGSMFLEFMIRRSVAG